MRCAHADYVRITYKFGTPNDIAAAALRPHGADFAPYPRRLNGQEKDNWAHGGQMGYTNIQKMQARPKLDLLIILIGILGLGSFAWDRLLGNFRLGNFA